MMMMMMTRMDCNDAIALQSDSDGMHTKVCALYYTLIQ